MRRGFGAQAGEVRAVRPNLAAIAQRPWSADASAVEDQGVRGLRPPSRWQLRDKLNFRFLGVCGLDQSEAARDAKDVSINRECGNPEGMAEHDIGGLSSDTGEFHQRIHVRRYGSTMLVDKRARHAEQTARLHPEETGGLDLPLQIVRHGGSERGGRRVPGEQPRRHLIHSGIGALGREDGRNQQFVRIRKGQFRPSPGMLAFEPVEDARRGRGCPSV